jgi:protein phosphatase
VEKQALVETDEVPVQPPAPQKEEVRSTLVKVDIGGLSHTGKVRSNNEDQFFVARFDRTMTPLLTNLPVEEFTGPTAEAGYAMLVADGMGGHVAGEVASRTTVSVLVDLMLRTPDWIMRLDDQWVEEAWRRARVRVQQIQAVLAERADQDPRLEGMGTTLTLAWSIGADLLLAHVGDSRAYLLRQGQLQQLTRDQTLAQEMVDAGAISQEEAASHRLRHILTGALSTNEKRVRVECRRLQLVDGDQILLCTDGLSDMVPDVTLVEVLQRPGSVADACQALIDRALEAGGKDNVTVVLARYCLPAPAG